MSLVNTVTGEIVESLSTEDARRLTDRIRLLSEGIADQLDKMADLIDQARVGSAWLALGYRSWTEYVSTEFAGILPRLDREPRQEFVRELTSRGMSTRAIAPVVGVSQMQVVRDQATRETDVSPRTPEPVGGGEAPSGSGQTPEGGVESGSGVDDVAVVAPSQATRPPVIGIDGKTYRPIDHMARANEAVAEFPELAFYRDEVRDLEHCWRLADKLREFRDRGEFDERIENLRRSIALDRSKRNGTYAPAAAPDPIQPTCPTCGQTVRN